MMHPDQYYLLMSLYGFEVGLAVIFMVRLTELLLDCMPFSYLSPAYLPSLR